MEDVPLLIEFAPHTSSIVNGSFSPSSQSSGMVRPARLSFSTRPEMSLPVFVRIREVLPDDQLSPARSPRMLLSSQRVATVSVDGRPVWRGGSRCS
jgi:hypothetical protein